MPSMHVNGADLFYEEAGSGEPLLLLHGLGSSTLDWEPQIKAFSPRYRVIALDARGSGRSRDAANPAGPFSIRQFAADAAAILERLGAAPAHVAGLSMGGMIAFQLAVDSPQSVRTLIIINSGPRMVPQGFKEHYAIAVRKAVSRILGPRAWGKVLAPKLFPRPDQEALRQRFIERMGMNDRKAYWASLKALLGWDVQDRIDAIKVPVLIVHSDQDYTKLAVKEGYARRMRNVQIVVVKDSRHTLPIEEPEKFFPILSEFLERN